MNIFEIITLFGIMLVLAALPSSSVVLVVTRSATLGTANGFAVAAGIILGDLIFIMLAILGLSIVAETMGTLFMVIKYLGAIYLLWLGFTLLTSHHKTTISINKNNTKGNLITSFFAGFLLTLGDVKAIVFYASLFPVFIDLSTLQVTEVLIIVLITVASVGGVKIFYALSATKVARLAKQFNFENTTKKVAGGFMISAGTYLIIKT